LLSKVIFFILSTLYIEHCLLVLPLFIAICEIWLLELTYGVYLVLFIKSGATIDVIKGCAVHSSFIYCKCASSPLFFSQEFCCSTVDYFLLIQYCTHPMLILQDLIFLISYYHVPKMAHDMRRLLITYY